MKHLFRLFILISLPLFAQKQVVQLENIEYSNFIKDETAFSLSNSETDELALVIPDKRSVTAYLFDENFERTDSITAESLRIKFKDIIGYRVTNKHYTTLFSTENKQFFGVVDFDFETGKTVTEQLDIDLKNEQLLETVTYDNRFFLLTLDDDFNGIVIRELLEDRTFATHKIEINGPVSFEDMLRLRNKADDLGELKGSVFNDVLPPQIIEIDNKNPNSLETTSRLNKLYAKDNNLILTFDNFQEFTLAYFIDLENFSVSEKRFQKQLIDNQNLEKSNSFIYQNYFFQIVVDNDRMVLTIDDFVTGNNIKTYRATKEQNINFKNSEILQKNGAFMASDGVRELNMTSQYLRKIANGQPGIAIQQINGIYQATIGGVQSSQDGGSSNAIVIGVTVAGLAGGMIGGMAITPFYNPTYASFGSYATTKSIYVESLFDTDFNHIEGYPVENVFDKIETFQESLKKVDAEEVFSHNGKVFFGYFEKKTHTYNIISFSTEE